MKFEFEYENIQFFLELVENKGYSPHPITNPMSEEELDGFDSGEYGFFDLFVISEKNGEKLSHYKPALALSFDPEDMQIELEEILFEENLLEPVISHWNYEESDLGPNWKKSE